MTQALLGPRRLRALLAEHNVAPRKELGQNFVIDPNTVNKIVDVSGAGEDDHVVEIGAGAGSLTLALAPRVARITAIEFDRALLPVLTAVVGGLDNVEVVNADALRFDLSSVEANTLMGNLPYNIAATIVLRALEDAPQLVTLTVMTQREVGERLAARPGSKDYGATSVLVRYFGEARVAARVSRRSFYPVPNVDSVIVRIVRDVGSSPVAYDHFRRVVKAAFSQRRKMLRNTLATTAASTDSAQEALRRAGLAATARAEEIDFDGFVAVAIALA
jgi:16S rRNA (adenine1518-N6/adenine1519-N6)-dimethyltransferase